MQQVKYSHAMMAGLWAPLKLFWAGSLASYRGAINN
jgi:hypothetical protein